MSVQRSRPDALRTAIVDDLELEAFPLRGYREDREYLEGALDAGYEVADLAEAHGVSKKSIYRAVDKFDLELRKPPSRGLAKRLLDADPDEVGGAFP